MNHNFEALKHNLSFIHEINFEFIQEAFKTLLKSRSHLKWASIVSFLIENEFKETKKDPKKSAKITQAKTNIEMLKLNQEMLDGNCKKLE